MMKARMQVQILQRAPFSSFRKELDAIGAPDTNPPRIPKRLDLPQADYEFDGVANSAKGIHGKADKC